MAVWNNGLVSPGFCSGISLLPSWCKVLDIVLFVRQEQVRVVEWFQEGYGTIHWAILMLVL